IYTPPNSFIHLTDQTQGLVAYDEDKDLQRFVIRQAYEGVASDFGLVLPTPSEPNFTARSEQLFKQLHDMTKEPVDRDRGGLDGIQTQALNQRERDVQVIKTRNVGDFTATVLKADNAEALVDWLRRNNYNFGQASRENFQYYIDRGGFYFTALKINVNRANCLTREEYRRWQNMDPRLRDRFRQPGGNYDGGRCYLIGGLQPVEFRFHAEDPMLPLRIMARPHDNSPLTGGNHENHQHRPGNFLIYTLSDQPLVIPGAKVEYAQRIGSPGGRLAKYTSAGRFLVRQRFKFDAAKVDHDLTFKQAAPFFVPREGSRVIEPDRTDTSNGMIAFSGNAIDVSFTRHPSPIAGINYRTSKVSHTAKEGVQAFTGIITVLLPVLGVTAGLVTSVPSVLLLLLLPLTF
ncbi:MAG: DUF2330 domain-containing protein, partial [Candidatus Nanohaloarchaea archaeon]|nr:DUF2330 domain-containing protein [Candidatus Nanohaloarchaea archaeon]